MLQVRHETVCQGRHRQGEISRIWMVIDYLGCVSGASLTADLYLHTTAPVWGALRRHQNEKSLKCRNVWKAQRSLGCVRAAAHSASHTNLSFSALRQLSQTFQCVWFETGVPTFLEVRRVRFCKHVYYSNFTQCQHSTHYSPNIYSNCIFFCGAATQCGSRPSHSWGFFLDHTQRRTTVGRTHLDEWSARRRDLYLTTHNTHNIQTSMPPSGIRTHYLSRRAAADLRLRPRGHWDRHSDGITTCISVNFNIIFISVLFEYATYLGTDRAIIRSRQKTI
jgi:hypothetical protein